MIDFRSPIPGQVFQRRTREAGRIHIQARIDGSPDTVEYRLTGESINGRLPGEWVGLELLTGGGGVDGWVPAPAGGWYCLELRATASDKMLATAAVDRVGVGEVFLGAGQSNSTSCGEFRTCQTSGMVANFTGEGWRPADDPQLGSADQEKKGCDGGSFYPAFGDALYAELGVPVGVAPTGCTGTTVRVWQPGGELYGRLAERMRQLGADGFRAVLWHQGETDIDVGMTEEAYYDFLRDTITSFRRDAGREVPWFVAHVSYPHAPDDNPIRRAQARLWRDGVALKGPDTDKLDGDHRDRTKVHFSPKGLDAHGKLWAEKVSALITSELNHPPTI